MEQNHLPAAAAAAIVPHEPSLHPKNKKDKASRSGKKRGPMQLVRVALFMLRRGHQKKKPPLHVEAAAATTGTLTKLVGSMRPLHLHDNDDDENNNNADGGKPQLPALTYASSPSPAKAASFEHFEDVFPPPSPSDGDASSSRFASAQNLQELDEDGDEDEEEGGEVVGEGDEMIDAKADEFIAQFYRQLGLQSLAS